MSQKKPSTPCVHCLKEYTVRGLPRHIKHCRVRITDERKELLKQRLEQQGCKLRDDSRLCNDYIENGGDIDFIVMTMREMKFYFEHTNYEVEYDRCRRGELEYKGCYDRDEISDSAKSSALRKWCEKFTSFEEIDKDILPQSLHDDVKNYFERKQRTKKKFNKTAVIETIKTFVKESTKDFDNSHGFDHALAVYENAKTISAELKLNGLDKFIVEVAALTHDVCDHKYPDSISFEQLENFIKNTVPKISYTVIDIIKNVSWSKEVAGKRAISDESKEVAGKRAISDQHTLKLLDIVSDADRLEAIGQIGIDRCIEYVSTHGGKVPEDVIQHCHDKLLKIAPHYIKTLPGKRMAEPLHQAIVKYVDAQATT